MPKGTIPIKGLKVNTLLSPAALPADLRPSSADLVPPEPRPAGNPVHRAAARGQLAGC
jgi:hypothetical protein